MFLTEWDGLRTDEHAHRVIVVGATNRPGDFDEAVLRRMPVKLRVGVPNAVERAQILRIILRSDRSLDAATLDRLPLSQIGQVCDGYTGSDLRELCKEAAMVAVRTRLAAERAGSADAGGDEPALCLHAAHFYQAMGVVGANSTFVRGTKFLNGMGDVPHFPHPKGLD